MNVFWVQKRKFLLLCAALISSLFILSSYSSFPRAFLNIFHSKDSIYCYRYSDKQSLPDVSEINPLKGKSIFFHETSCNSYRKGKVWISARQACAVESAAKLNPDFEVYLLFTSPGDVRAEGEESDGFLAALMSYPNVKIMHLNYEKYTKGTPLEYLYRSGTVENSKYSQSHASDVLRYLTLWKYGGIYLDLDVIVVKPLKNLTTNYAGAESDDNVAAGVLSFAPEGPGHDLAVSCIEDLKNNFDGSNWGSNGPGVITRLLKKLCDTRRAKDMVKKPSCGPFKVYQREFFYAIPWWEWGKFFDETAGESIVSTITNKSYVAHVWNKHSGSTKLTKDSKAAYAKLARRFCPKVMGECKDFF